MEKKYAIHIQTNAHLIPKRFWDMLITSDQKRIGEYRDRGMIVLELTDAGQRELAEYDGRVVCFGDIQKHIK